MDETGALQVGCQLWVICVIWVTDRLTVVARVGRLGLVCRPLSPMPPGSFEAECKCGADGAALPARNDRRALSRQSAVPNALPGRVDSD
jgi:hypothetical protein